MARLKRLDIAGQAYHVIQRGNNRQPIFFEREDYLYFLSLLHEFSGLFKCDIHAYVLMTNHIHLLITPQRAGSLSKFMQFIGRRYVRYINKTYERTGTLWEGRFKSSILDSEQYLLGCMRYIELNPVRARMVNNAKLYDWSSYRRNALGVQNDLINSHPLYANLAPAPAKRQAAYCALFNTNTDEETFNDIRSALQGGWALGSDKFKKKLQKSTGLRVEPLKRGGDRRSKKFNKQ